MCADGLGIVLIRFMLPPMTVAWAVRDAGPIIFCQMGVMSP